MALKGTRIEKEYVREREIKIRTCDICGEDATERTPCTLCKRDLCQDHQIDVREITSAYYWKREDLQIRGVHCKECLLKLINEKF